MSSSFRVLFGVFAFHRKKTQSEARKQRMRLVKLLLQLRDLEPPHRQLGGHRVNVRVVLSLAQLGHNTSAAATSSNLRLGNSSTCNLLACLGNSSTRNLLAWLGNSSTSVGSTSSNISSNVSTSLASGQHNVGPCIDIRAAVNCICSAQNRAKQAILPGHVTGETRKITRPRTVAPGLAGAVVLNLQRGLGADALPRWTTLSELATFSRNFNYNPFCKRSNNYIWCNGQKKRSLLRASIKIGRRLQAQKLAGEQAGGGHNRHWSKWRSVEVLLGNLRLILQLLYKTPFLTRRDTGWLAQSTQS